VKKAYPIKVLCEVMQVSRSGYYAWCKREGSARESGNLRLVPLVRELHRQSGRTYGTRRIADDLREQGVLCGRYRARTLMAMAGVSARQKRKFKATTDSSHEFPVAPNLLGREFSAEAPDRVWVSDITYVWTREGWLYLAVVIDLFSRMVVGWSIGERITRRLVMDALRMGAGRRRPAPGLVHHSDRGVQYCSGDFRSLITAFGMTCSMSRKGDCWDNAVAESFFGKLKTERVFFADYKTRDEARRDIVDYIEMFYNSRRRHSYLGNISPRRFEEMRQVQNAA
jgi:putative transposase